MIKFIFENNYVENEGEFFKQLEGIGTGSRSSPMIGDIIVDSVDKPQKIIGISGDDGTLLNTNYKKLNFLNKKILKNEK